VTWKDNNYVSLLRVISSH